MVKIKPSHQLFKWLKEINTWISLTIVLVNANKRNFCVKARDPDGNYGLHLTREWDQGNKIARFNFEHSDQSVYNDNLNMYSSAIVVTSYSYSGQALY